MKFFRPLLAVLALPVMAAAAEPHLALGDHEALTYRVAWAFLPGAGEIRVTGQATTDAAGAPQLRVITTTATSGIAKRLFHFEARADSLFDRTTGRLLTLTESSQNRDKHAEHSVAFDYTAKVANYLTTPATAPRPLALPAGDPLDLITSLLQTREWDLKPGEKRDALVLFDDEFYELTLHAIAYEELSIGFGTFKTLILEPRMEKTEPKGMFKKGSTVRVWISQDERRLPVRFRVDFKFGSGTATLVDYRPPVVQAPKALAADEKNSRP